MTFIMIVIWYSRPLLIYSVPYVQKKQKKKQDKYTNNKTNIQQTIMALEFLLIKIALVHSPKYLYDRMYN